MAAASRAAGEAVKERLPILSRSMRAPFASLLSQTYGKPVQLNLTQIARPHLEPSILAAVAAEKMRDRDSTPRTVQRQLVEGVTFPQEKDVPNIADFERISTRALRRRPALQSIGAQRSSIKSVLDELNPKRVSSILMRIGGRYGRRLTADRSENRVSRKGLSAKGISALMRNVRPLHIGYALRAGKRKIGAYGVKVWVGHS